MFVMESNTGNMKKSLFAICMLAVMAAGAQTKTLLYPNGNKMSEGTLTGADPVVFTPGFAQLDKETQMRYLDLAKREGTWKQWYESGQLKAEENYVNGVLQGNARHFYPDGSNESFLHIGSQQNSVFYYRNGNKESEGRILTGYLYEGPWKGWQENGQMAYEGSYVNGQRDGIWNWYDETGKLRTRQVFNNGNLVTENNY